MLRPEDQKLLGMMPKRCRPTAVSQALRAISDDLENGPGKWDVTDDDGFVPAYRMIVATDRETRRRAYALAHRVYQGRGYAANEEGLIISPFDANPDTLTLLAQDASGSDAATITLIFDSAGRLP